MLVLTRKLQQQTKIGDQITVTVLRVKGNTVRIGVQAPREVRVVRGELPKVTTGQAAEAVTPQEVVICACEPVTDSEEQTGEVTEAACANSVKLADPPSPVSAPHLPLKRIRDRYGAGPLKQVIAACPTLAK